MISKRGLATSAIESSISSIFSLRPKSTMAPERNAFYLCLISEDVDDKQKQKIQTPTNT